MLFKSEHISLMIALTLLSPYASNIQRALHVVSFNSKTQSSLLETALNPINWRGSKDFSGFQEFGRGHRAGGVPTLESHTTMMLTFWGVESLQQTLRLMTTSVKTALPESFQRLDEWKERQKQTERWRWNRRAFR